MKKRLWEMLSICLLGCYAAHAQNVDYAFLEGGTKKQRNKYCKMMAERMKSDTGLFTLGPDLQSYMKEREAPSLEIQYDPDEKCLMAVQSRWYDKGGDYRNRYEDDDNEEYECRLEEIKTIRDNNKNGIFGDEGDEVICRSHTQFYRVVFAGKEHNLSAKRMGKVLWRESKVLYRSRDTASYVRSSYVDYRDRDESGNEISKERKTRQKTVWSDELVGCRTSVKKVYEEAIKEMADYYAIRDAMKGFPALVKEQFGIDDADNVPPKRGKKKRTVFFSGLNTPIRGVRMDGP